MSRPVSTLFLATVVALAACSPENSELLAPAIGPVLAASAANKTPSSVSLVKIGGFANGGVGASEIPAYDEVSKRIFVVNGALGSVDVYDAQNPTAPMFVERFTFSGGANSVAASKGVVAVAVQAADGVSNGTVHFYRATTLEKVSVVTVGALPDMLTFSASGRTVVVANEGEPNRDYSIDPVGSVSIIDVSNINKPTVRQVGFDAFNGQAAALRASGVRIYGPNATVAQDFEPEYVTISDDESKAWVSLQENNALAVIDLASATVSQILPLGFKNHSLAGNGLDVSDRDNAINIRTWPVFGMYQPDAIGHYTANGQTYIVTANEGDARDYIGFAEEARVSTLSLNTSIFTSAICGGTCNAASRLGRLTVTNTLGRNPVTGLYDALYVLGARSFSIWTASGTLVYDSGDQLEQLTKNLSMVNFNASNTGNTADDRSDNKGPEPEGLVIAKFGEKTMAFIGLERVGGVAVYDITNPTAPIYQSYINTRTGATGDLGPEGITFVPANRSPNKEPLIIVGNEVSGTTAIFQVKLNY
ncbi:choice-of-anchor I family protein [Gemmatimonas groenlandica]|uniref:Alkaline phosphatase n=1 Tax=Gemmatimonas groenlandica TaxID=2732249 RepID=A0A6M4ISR1_9BACT|nr:choice-of-anchor I family protein [Gemmatimonas groenlandica]QJR36759.1 alkaline phosphatase [Gemmatimonas groenlandica]